MLEVEHVILKFYYLNDIQSQAYAKYGGGGGGGIAQHDFSCITLCIISKNLFVFLDIS
jgi:hypothetical protein